MLEITYELNFNETKPQRSIFYYTKANKQNENIVMDKRTNNIEWVGAKLFYDFFS